MYFNRVLSSTENFSQTSFGFTRTCCAAAVHQYTTDSAVWATVEEGAVAPVSGKYLLRLLEGLEGSVVGCLLSDLTLVGLSPCGLSLWSWATYKSGAGHLQRRQDLPADAFCFDEMNSERVALFYRWLSPGVLWWSRPKLQDMGCGCDPS